VSLPIDFPFVTVGDSFPSTEAWRLAGFTDENTDRGRLHATFTVVGGELQVSLYSDRDKANLVAQGQAATNARATLAEMNDSGISGSVFITNVNADNIVVFVALATDLDIERRDDRIRGLLGEDPAECDFSAVWDFVIREFYVRIQANFPPPAFVSDPLRFPGSGQVQTAGRRGLPDVHAIHLWHLNGEGDWELKGLENPGDWRTWATLYSLHLIWDRRARSGDDELVARADRYLSDSDRAWSMVPVLVDSDGDSVPERQVKTRSSYLTRG